MGPQIRITPNARAELAWLLAGERGTVRVSIRPGGCSGLRYSVDVDPAIGRHDLILFDDGKLRVTATAGDAAVMDGLTIDYSSELVVGGFQFERPGNEGRCACGTSFSRMSGA